jgi:hypothetical protein
MDDDRAVVVVSWAAVVGGDDVAALDNFLVRGSNHALMGKHTNR